MDVRPIPPRKSGMAAKPAAGANGPPPNTRSPTVTPTTVVAQSHQNWSRSRIRSTTALTVAQRPLPRFTTCPSSRAQLDDLSPAARVRLAQAPRPVHRSVPAVAAVLEERAPDAILRTQAPGEPEPPPLGQGLRSVGDHAQLVPPVTAHRPPDRVLLPPNGQPPLDVEGGPRLM